MKFDFVIGNPPYQDESNGEKRNYAPPVYHLFLDAAYQLGDVVEMIHPARFLFNAGSTPKSWNEKMLNDCHLKVPFYEPDSDKVFPGLSTPIKGGIAVTYRNTHNCYGAIQAFTPYNELNSIVHKVNNEKSFKSLSSIVYSRTSYRLTDMMHHDYPFAAQRQSKGHAYDMSSNIFKILPEIFHDTKPDDCYEYIAIIGRDGQRVTKYIRRSYVNTVENLDSYKLFIAQANGSGFFGEVLSPPIIAEPGIGHTETFLSIGNFSNVSEAKALQKYIKSKFLRALLGVLKVTQNGNKPVWKMIPIQDFTLNSDIDWSGSVADIDRQLYRKYGLSEDEISFIEEKVKEMV